MSQTTTDLAHLSLGKSVSYTENYTPSLLQAVPRTMNREPLGIADTQPFHGIDIWNGYELSWLNPKGKPQVAILRADVDGGSENLIESKSFKLYLNSFNQSRFNSIEEVRHTLESDLTACANGQVRVSVYPMQALAEFDTQPMPGECIDDADIDVESYSPQPNMLATSEEQVSETLCSHLLKSNCLITSQPDWASIAIRYTGAKIDRESLLKYLISFRQHNEFHEQCVERIFCDINSQCKPAKLTVYARYTRRGGLDINPFRSNFEQPWPNFRLHRQ